MNTFIRMISDHFDDDDDDYSDDRGPRRPSKRDKREEEKFYRDLDREESAGFRTNRRHSDPSPSSTSSPLQRRGDHHNGEPSERSYRPSSNKVTPRSHTNVPSSSAAPGSSPSPPMEDENVLMATLVLKDKEIARLEKELSTNTNIKTFGKRMAKLEKDKNEELEDVKKHYKSMMENIAKQAQRANERYDDEFKKNTKLRETMDEMRNDMATREQNLEEKIVALGKMVKEGNSTKEMLEQKVEQLQVHALELDKKLKAAMLSEKGEKDRNRNLEAKFDFEKREMNRAFEKEKEEMLKNFSQKESALKNNKKDTQMQLDMVSKKLELEEQKHEATFVKLQQTERALMEKDRNVKELEAQVQEIEREHRQYRRKTEKEIEGLQKWKKERYQEIKETTSIQINNKLGLHSEMKELKSKLEAAEKKIQLQEDLIKKKAGALKRKTEEMEQLQHQFNFNTREDSIDQSPRDLAETKPSQVNADELKDMVEQLLLEKLSFENVNPTNHNHLHDHKGNFDHVQKPHHKIEEESRVEDMEEKVQHSSRSIRFEEDKNDIELRSTSDDPKKVLSRRRSTTPIRARTLSQLKSKMSIYSMNE